MTDNPFFELHRELARQGPGDPVSTARALFAVPEVPHRPNILDLGCGPGAQTLDLARLLPDARITAVDLHQPFLDELNQRAGEAGFSDRITTLRGDLCDPPATEPVDLIWAEGSAYFLGFEAVLTRWPALLARGGAIALTEPVRLVDPLPPRVEALWRTEYEVRPLETLRNQVSQAGLVLHDSFVLDVEAWRAYYGPLQQRVDRLRPEADAALTKVLDLAQEEIDTFWAHPNAVGYAFFIFGRPQRKA